MSDAGYGNRYVVTTAGEETNQIRVFSYLMDNTQTPADTGFAISILC